MSAVRLCGKTLAAELKVGLAKKIDELKHKTRQQIRVVSIIVGDNPQGLSYCQGQAKAAQDLGIHYELEQLKSDAKAQEVLGLIRQLNDYPQVHGIIINKPLPRHLDFKEFADAIYPLKDIEGVGVGNLGALLLGTRDLAPCTAAAAVALLKSSGLDLSGKHAVIVGRSEIVGKPVALLLLKENMTVTVCHSKTTHLAQYTTQAHVVIAAIGKKHYITANMIKPGAAVIDVGINDDAGKITGDVDYPAVEPVAGYLSPVPGGVGPLTSVMLMQNAVAAFEEQIRNFGKLN